MHRIYVVAFCPSTESGGVGGFYWTTTEETAARTYELIFRDSAAEGGDKLVRLLATHVRNEPTAENEELVTGELEQRYDELENTGPALRQYVPSCTKPEWVPTGCLTSSTPSTTVTAVPVENTPECTGICLNPASVRQEVEEAAEEHGLDAGVAQALLRLDDQTIVDALNQSTDDYFWAAYDGARSTAITALAKVVSSPAAA